MKIRTRKDDREKIRSHKHFSKSMIQYLIRLLIEN